MRSIRSSAPRLLPDGTSLKNQLLARLPLELYALVSKDLRMIDVVLGAALLEAGVPARDVYFPNGGVYSVTNQMRDGELVEVATVGIEGMLGIGVFLGDNMGTGRTLQQVPNGRLPAMPVARFIKHTSEPGPFRDAIARYTQAHMLQVMQCTACNVLHRLEQRCARWLLQTHDRVDGDEFLLKQEFLAIMLGTNRPSVSLAMGSLQKAGAVTSRYGRITVVDRKKLERSSCECHEVIRAHFRRLGI